MVTDNYVAMLLHVLLKLSFIRVHNVICETCLGHDFLVTSVCKLRNGKVKDKYNLLPKLFLCNLSLILYAKMRYHSLVKDSMYYLHGKRKIYII